MHGTHDLFAVFHARADGEPRPKTDEVVDSIGSHSTRRMLMPWHPGRVRTLFEGRVSYYIDRDSA
jgi:hypothetical protein